LQNILIVCADKNLRKEISKTLATELKFLYVDVDEILDFEILNKQDTTIIEAGDVMKNLETKSIDRALKFKDCVITCSRDLFVANDNFKKFDKHNKIFVKLSKAYFVARFNSKDRNRLEQELLMFDSVNKLVEVNCNFAIEREAKTIEQIKDDIINILKKS